MAAIFMLPALPADVWLLVNFFDGWRAVPEPVQAPIAIAAVAGVAITLLTLPALLLLAVRNIQKASAPLLLVLAICVVLTAFPLLLLAMLFVGVRYSYRG